MKLNVNTLVLFLSQFLLFLSPVLPRLLVNFCQSNQKGNIFCTRSEGVTAAGAASQCYQDDLMLLKVWANAIKDTRSTQIIKNGFLHPTKCLERVLKYSYLVSIILNDQCRVPRFWTPWMFNSSTPSRGVALLLDDTGTSVYNIVVLITYMYCTLHL